jgi:hypothetical protein
MSTGLGSSNVFFYITCGVHSFFLAKVGGCSVQIYSTYIYAINIFTFQMPDEAKYIPDHVDVKIDPIAHPKQCPKTGTGHIAVQCGRTKQLWGIIPKLPKNKYHIRSMNASLQVRRKLGWESSLPRLEHDDLLFFLHASLET